MVTPVDTDAYEKLLIESDYCKEDSRYLLDGFRNGFDLGFRESISGLRREAPNLPLRVGSKTKLWNKVMKEVKLGRYAGPFKTPPFDEYIQSPIGLVPKDNGKDVRLIFHLSFPQVRLRSFVQSNTQIFL